MPWVWRDAPNGYTRRRRRRNRRNYARSYTFNRPDYGLEGGSGYGDDSEEYSPPDQYDNGSDDILGIYDARGRRLGAVDISSPPDMLPPYADGGDYQRVRRRARF